MKLCSNLEKNVNINSNFGDEPRLSGGLMLGIMKLFGSVHYRYNTSGRVYLPRFLKSATKVAQGEDKLASKLSVTEKEEASKSCQMEGEPTVDKYVGEQSGICKSSLNSQRF